MKKLYVLVMLLALHSCSLSPEDFPAEDLSSVSKTVPTLSGEPISVEVIQTLFQFSDLPNNVAMDPGIYSSIKISTTAMKDMLTFVVRYQGALEKRKSMEWDIEENAYRLEITGHESTISFIGYLNDKELFTSELARNFRSGYTRLNYKHWYEKTYADHKNIKNGFYDSAYKIYDDGRIEIDIDCNYNFNSVASTNSVTVGSIRKASDGSGFSELRMEINQQPMVAQSFIKSWTSDGVVVEK